MKYLWSKIMYIGILIMLGFQVNAQQNIDWASSGATWVYGNWSNMDIQFYLKMTYVKDTLVFNQEVKKMYLTKLSLLIPPNSEPIGSPNETYFGVEYMYESNDTVYRFNPFGGFSFDVLYVFNPIIGDTIQINKKENITHPCQTNSDYDLYEVDSVFTLNQGELWSAYRTKSVLGKWNFASAFPVSHWDEPYIGSLIINGIGSLGSPFPIPIFSDTCIFGTDLHPRGLSCYSDSVNGVFDFGQNTGFISCETLVNTSNLFVKQEKDLVNIQVYPNPVQSILNLKFSDYYKYRNQKTYIQVFDITGKLIRTEPIRSEQTFMNIEKLSSGIYLLKLVVENTATKNIKFVKI
jgi:hypothetical protein